MKSEAQKKANTKYMTNARATGKIKQFNLTLRGEDYNMIDNYCKNIGVSKAACIVAAVKYCMDNNVDLKQTADATEVAPGTSEV